MALRCSNKNKVPLKVIATKEPNELMRCIVLNSWYSSLCYYSDTQDVLKASFESNLEVQLKFFNNNCQYTYV